MKKMKVSCFHFALVLCFSIILILTACSSNTEQSATNSGNQTSGEQKEKGENSNGETKFIRFGGGIGGSSWELTAGKLADMFNTYVSDISVTAQPGDMGENLGKLARKEAELGLTYSFVLKEALEGTGDFEEHKNPDLRFMLNLFPSYEQILVPKDAPWETIKDLGKDPSQLKIAALTPGSGTYILIDGVLKAVGTSLDDVAEKGGVVQPFDYSQGAEGMKNGTINAIPIIGPPNHPTILDLEKETKFLTYDDETLEKIEETIPGAVPAIFPGHYEFLSGDYETFAIFTSVVTHADVPEEDVYNMTKAFWENVDDFKSLASYTEETSIEQALSGATIPIHPGALKYYEEVGIEVPEQ